MPHASIIARLGEKDIEEIRAADFWALLPFYKRKNAAEERIESDSARG